MGVEKGEAFLLQDVFVDYDFEDVKFRWEHKSRRLFRKFYGRDEEDEVSFENRLFNDALMFGQSISREAYFRT